MTLPWCKVTYGLMEVSTCDAALWPSFISGLFIGIVIMSVLDAILFLAWRRREKM
jgi:hypothetical protein